MIVLVLANYYCLPFFNGFCCFSKRARSDSYKLKGMLAAPSAQVSQVIRVHRTCTTVRSLLGVSCRVAANTHFSAFATCLFSGFELGLSESTDASWSSFGASCGFGSPLHALRLSLIFVPLILYLLKSLMALCCHFGVSFGASLGLC